MEYDNLLCKLQIIRIQVERGSHDEWLIDPDDRTSDTPVRMALTVLDTAIAGLTGNTDYPRQCAEDILTYFKTKDCAGLLENAARLTSAGLALGDE